MRPEKVEVAREVGAGPGGGIPCGAAAVLHHFCPSTVPRGHGREGGEGFKGQADAQVLIHGASRTKRSLSTFYSGMGGYGWRGWGAGGFGTATTTASEYTEGTLVVEAKAKQLMWRGVAQGELKDKPEKREKQLQKVSDRFFKDFPPGSGKK